MAKRKAISKRVRFEVFKRDGFKCQYCGRSAPDVLLHVDHIHPVAKGGSGDILNLATSCADCNSGKGDRALDDDSVLSRQRVQLQEANERLGQLKLMVSWREGLRKSLSSEVDAVAEAYGQACPGWSVNDTGRRTVTGHLKKHGLAAVLDAIDKASDRVTINNQGKATEESAHRFWRLLWVFLQPWDIQQLYIVRAMMRNRFGFINEQASIRVLREALDAGATIEQLKEVVMEETSWSGWKSAMRSRLDG